MQYYMAPLEGITTWVFRKAYHACFRPMDKYFTPSSFRMKGGALPIRKKMRFSRSTIRGRSWCPRS